jgi:hypothetical protein
MLIYSKGGKPRPGRRKDRILYADAAPVRFMHKIS